MEKHLLKRLICLWFLIQSLAIYQFYSALFFNSKRKLALLFLLFSIPIFAQPPHTFTSNGSLEVPAGITSVTVEAWGAGGAGGGASGALGTTGRSAGGGGGGAYAKGTITVVAGNTLNAIVGKQTTGTAISGTTGESSTILGFETSILALGGSGGTANTTGNQPAGGAGGTASGSIGNLVKTSGTAGDAGNAVLIAALLASGKGGNSPNGGNGGAAASTLLLASFPGNAGTPPGGGGSGAINCSGAAAQLGGNGAAGQVKVTYVCPTYSISGTATVGVTADNVCATSGTSEVTITTAAASLPIGVYTVTYGRGNPITTSGSATMTVSVAGTGKFTATGLTTVGASRITVTNLKSGVCSSTTNNYANITVFSATVAGAVTGGTTICSGQTSASLSLGGNTGVVTKWQSMANSASVWTDIVNTTTSYTSLALTETTQFRTAVKNGACDEVFSTPTTVTVNPLPQGSLTANGPFCDSGSPQLIFTATAGTGPYTVVYTENNGVNRSATGVVSGAAFTPFTTSINASTVYNLVSVTGANTCVRNSGFTGGTATVTVNPLPQGSLTANGPFCDSGSPQLIFTATAGTGPYTVVYTENNGVNRSATGVVSGVAFTPFTTSINTSTVYNLVSVTGANTCVRNSGFTSGAATVTVNPLPQGSLTANGPFCDSGSPQLIFTATAGTGPYTIIYTENNGINRSATGVVSGAAFTPFTTSINASTVYNLVSVTGANTCVRNSGFTSGAATVTVNPLPQGSLTANGPFCDSGSPQLIFTATAGTGPYTIVYTENNGINRSATGVVSGVAFTPFTTSINTSTVYNLVSVTGANTCVRNSGFTGGAATVTVNQIPVPVFDVQPASSVCVNTSVTYTTQSGQSNYIWSVSGTAGSDYTILSGGITNLSNTVTLQWNTIGNKTVKVRYTSKGCSAVLDATSLTTVTKTVPGVVSGGSHVCSGDPSPLLTVNGYTGTIVRWEYAEALPYVWQSISNTTNTYQPGILAVSTSYRAVVKDGTCAEEFATETRIDIDAKPAPPLIGTVVQPTCINPTGSIVLNGLEGVPNWTIAQTGTSSQNYTGSGNNYTVLNLVPGNYSFTIYQVASCPSLSTISVEIKAPVTNVWDGSVWSKGVPPVATDAIVFTGNYQTNGNLSGCSCTVNSGVEVTVNSNHTLTIDNSVTNNGGKLIFENNASLVQVNSAANTGNITYKRNTTPVRRYDFTFWSSPVTRTPAFTLKELSPNTLADKYYKYDAVSGWQINYGGTAPMVAGNGYIVRAPQNFDINTPVIYNATFTGVPNNGTITVPIPVAEKSYLLGNPYPSAIYADQFIISNSSNLYGTLYFWTHNSAPNKDVQGNAIYNYTTDDYAIYNLTGSTTAGQMHGDGATTPGNQNPPLGYIAAGQSFFVDSKTTQSAVFTNAMRVPGNNSQFFKTVNSNKENIERHRVWINLTNTQGAFKQILVGYVQGATNGWDNNYDGLTVDGNKYLDFYSINEDRKLVVQGRALPFLESDTISLGYRTIIAGEFTIAIDHADGDLSTHAIFLEDTKTDTMQDLQKKGYTFTTAIGTFLDRFVVRYAKTLGTGDFENPTNTILISTKDKVIAVRSQKELLSGISVYDVNGTLIYKTKDINALELQIPNMHAGAQVLLVKVTLENGSTTVQKVIY
ncbi:T9SS sorting signal type C domain-containing protein [Flavobacterium branchiicola]|uniref:T9SS sorting signal type C domain-containing protein n=1 Tax=Flavobacterium branchiicola TaxID=1114875 RepID=A0ABV9PI30_9FLAO|nr:T9SS sorting signal type C domain-containing protein [Flavobacterium branchiicola]MBS7256168.1 T9SS type A sorting domain-containing protein [Flavobacterium branchiicola]